MDYNGDLITCNSIDTGDESEMRKVVVPKCLHLKLGCPVMLVKNFSTKLVNGIQGTVLSTGKDCHSKIQRYNY